MDLNNQSVCVGLLGVDAQRKLIKQRSTGIHPVYPHGNWNSFVPAFFGPFILRLCFQLQPHLLCFTHMFESKPAALYWSDKGLQCEQIASSTHLLPGLQFIFFHKVSFHFCCGKTKDVIPSFLVYAILNSWRQFDTYFNLPSLLWMSYMDVHCTWVILVSEADFIIRMTIM